MSLSLITHEYKTIRGKAVLTRQRPYVRVFAESGPPVFIQGGQFYTEGGQEIPEAELPDWVWDEIGRMSETAKQEAGISKKSDRNSISTGAAKK